MPRLRTNRRPRLVGVGHAEKVEDHRQGVAQRLIEQEEPAGHLVPGRRRAVVLGDPVEAALELADGLKGNRIAVRHAVGLEGRQAPCPAPLQKLEAQATLARTGLGHDAHHLSVACE